MIYKYSKYETRDYEEYYAERVLLSVISLADNSMKTDIPNYARARAYKNQLHYRVVQTDKRKQ